MNKKRKTATIILFSLAGLVLAAGLLAAAQLLQLTRLSRYPLLISSSNKEERHRLTVPGEEDIYLSRTGAYGIYHEMDVAEDPLASPLYQPPAISCVLISHATGDTITAVPDYVESNRYTNKAQDLAGVLMMSLSVGQPGRYTFACDTRESKPGSEITVSLGPNYTWEFFRTLWKIGLPGLGGITLLCGSLLISMALGAVGLVLIISTHREKPQKDSLPGKARP